MSVTKVECPECGQEFRKRGKGPIVTCQSCGKKIALKGAGNPLATRPLDPRIVVPPGNREVEPL